MKEMLKGGLEWFCSEKKGKGNFAAKLEGRYIGIHKHWFPL